MLYNVKVNHEDLGEFESAEKLWQAISEADLVAGDLAAWEDIDDSSVPALLKEAKDQGFIDDYDLEEIPDREPLEDYLEDALEYPEHVNPVDEALTAVLTGAREFAGLKITDDQIQKYIDQIMYSPDDYTDKIEDQVVRAIGKVDYQGLVRWVDWVGGDDTAANLLNE
ncbi:hypothetical protein LOB97_00285 [Lactobacillus delbrueckii subsp. lactis]|uniref:hypothetical protein n=1 Tax=Lactobacillus delbrueckii TaxID=1584 RepID=UPI001E3394FB|nr:hypothetical protein [Lactobacillus delbrueckii]MCD5603292.1 hypothetical protein [Lactobacillus delbrueckii subsp. lactis]